jgi:hypothetical protein
MIIGEGIAVSEFVARREALLDQLEGAIGLVLAGDHPASLQGIWQPDWNFYYLSGIRDEPGLSYCLTPRRRTPSGARSSF